MSQKDAERVAVLVVGGGPAGLAAAETAAEAIAEQGGEQDGAKGSVMLVERMPSVGRKLLMAGKSGLNLTHAEPKERFRQRFGEDAPRLAPMLDAFPPEALRAWAAALGQETFAGPTGRVFPSAMKASPLLRAWLARLRSLGVRIETRARLTTLDGRRARIEKPEGARDIEAGAIVLALGGASWPRLGSDGGWTGMLAGMGAPCAPFRASNVGWEIAWSAPFRERHAGAPLKAIRLLAGEATSRGELVVTPWGLEGGGLYPLAPALMAMDRPALTLDLAPDRSVDALARALAKAAAAKQSLANQLRRAARLTGAKAALLRETGPPPCEPEALARRIKALTLPLRGPRPIEEAISTAGGVGWEGLDDSLMIRAAPGVFVAGEMIDWDAPTGGYLLSASFATGRWAGRAAAGFAMGG